MSSHSGPGINVEVKKSFYCYSINWIMYYLKHNNKSFELSGAGPCNKSQNSLL